MIKSAGATLPITLILLFVVTLLGVSAMQMIHLQEKMSSNLQDKELSFNAAESGLSIGENWILSQTRQPQVSTSCSTSPCVLNTLQNFNYTTQSNSWWTANAAGYSSTLKNVRSAPYYFIEFVQFVPDSPIVGDSSMKSTGVFYYQITSRGTGSSDDAISIVQSTFGRRY